MATGARLGALVIGLGMLTTVSLPNRQFARVVDSFTRFATGVLGTAMGTK